MNPALMVTGIAICGVLAGLSVYVNLQRACVVHDTPYLGLCPALSATQYAAALRSRITANPGDTRAYVELARIDASPSRQLLVDTAARLAPSHPQVMLLQAATAIERQQWAQAIAPLVTLVENHNSEAAALVLARIVGAGQSTLLEEHLGSGRRWLQSVLAKLPQAQAPISAALPLVAQALKRDALRVDDLTPYVGQLKAAGAWTDAYSLWLTLHGKPLPILYNAGFDQDFQRDGFDWEVSAQGPASRAGAVVDRGRIENRGAVLDIRFTGRAIAIPMVRQYLFLGEGRYRLRGEYKAGQLRFERGLTWAVRCIAKPTEIAGQSVALSNTDNNWQPFEFEFTLPRGCGGIASLQLETMTPLEATVGSRGRATFDALSLQRLPS